jgi:hypothetical protein
LITLTSSTWTWTSVRIPMSLQRNFLDAAEYKGGYIWELSIFSGFS